jgi:hypothetical protein
MKWLSFHPIKTQIFVLAAVLMLSACQGQSNIPGIDATPDTTVSAPGEAVEPSLPPAVREGYSGVGSS